MNLEEINRVWPKIGCLFAVLISILVFAFWNKSPDVSKVSLLFWFNLAVLMFHEFEEYVVPGGFKKFINTKTVLSLPESDIKEPVSDLVIVSINLGSWVIFIIAALSAQFIPFLGLGMIFFNVINIVGHLIIFQKKVKGYNPGLITAILMIPYLIFAVIFVMNHNLFSLLEFFAAILIGIISGISLPICGAILRKKALEKKK